MKNFKLRYTLIALTAISLVSCTRVGASEGELISAHFQAAQECTSAKNAVPPASEIEINVDAILDEDPDAIAFDECYTELAESEEFAPLGLLPLTEQIAEIRRETFVSWKCIEDAGYARERAIPLSAPGGWALLPTPRDFGVSGEEDILTFYKTAADCFDQTVDDFRNPFGELIEGDEELVCEDHTHDGAEHRHNCDFAEEYPDDLGL